MEYETGMLISTHIYNSKVAVCAKKTQPKTPPLEYKGSYHLLIAYRIQHPSIWRQLWQNTKFLNLQRAWKVKKKKKTDNEVHWIKT